MHATAREMGAGGGGEGRDGRGVGGVDCCTDTVRESALKVDSGRKIPCRTRDSNPRQY